MNLEDLTKSQLLLLTVFVNFVTSIAVGVLTVSLLDQAPPTITQTVNRIVDHTVEVIASTTPIQKIIPSAPASTVVTHDEDLLTAALAANMARQVTHGSRKSKDYCSLNKQFLANAKGSQTLIKSRASTPN